MTVTDSLLSIVPVAVAEILALPDDKMRKAVLHHVSILGLNSAEAESATLAIDIALEKSQTQACIVLDSGMVGVDAQYIEGIGRVTETMVILLHLEEVLSLEAAAA